MVSADRPSLADCQLVDSCIKNGGDHFLAEVASKEFVDEMSGLIKSPVSLPCSMKGDMS